MIANYISGNTIYDWSWDVTTPGLRVDYNIQESIYGDYFISKSDKCTQGSKKNNQKQNSHDSKMQTDNLLHL